MCSSLSEWDESISGALYWPILATAKNMVFSLLHLAHDAVRKVQTNEDIL